MKRPSPDIRPVLWEANTHIQPLSQGPSEKRLPLARVPVLATESPALLTRNAFGYGHAGARRLNLL